MLRPHRARVRAHVLIVLVLLMAGWGCGGEKTEIAADEPGAVSSAGTSDRSGGAVAPDAATARVTPDGTASSAGEGASSESNDGTAVARDPRIASGATARDRVSPEDVTRVLAQAPKYSQLTLPAPDERGAAPQLQLVDMSGREIRLDELRGRVVLLAFWATWCRPCIMEIPHLIHLTDTYADAGFTILGLSVDRNGLADVKPFIERRPEINYPIVPNGTPAAMKFGGIRSIPTSYLLDRQGRVIRAFVGLQPPEILEGHIQAALREAI